MDSNKKWKHSINKYPQFYDGGISPGQKWWWTVLEHRNFMQSMGRLSMHSKCLDFFSFKFWCGGGFFTFFLCSHHVPFAFPSGSHSVPKFLPLPLLAQAKNGQTNSFANRNFMQAMGRLSMHSWLIQIFSFFLSGGWGQGVFVFFSLVPNLFPSSSQVPKVLQMRSPRCYQ